MLKQRRWLAVQAQLNGLAADGVLGEPRALAPMHLDPHIAELQQR